LMIGAPLGRAGGNPHRNCTISTRGSRRRNTDAGSVGQVSSRGSRFWAAVGKTTGARIWLNAARRGCGFRSHCTRGFDGIVYRVDCSRHK
jgi:hypothetical protein